MSSCFVRQLLFSTMYPLLHSNIHLVPNELKNRADWKQIPRSVKSSFLFYPQRISLFQSCPILSILREHCSLSAMFFLFLENVSRCTVSLRSALFHCLRWSSCILSFHLIFLLPKSSSQYHDVHSLSMAPPSRLCILVSDLP